MLVGSHLLVCHLCGPGGLGSRSLPITSDPADRRRDIASTGLAVSDRHAAVVVRRVRVRRVTVPGRIRLPAKQDMARWTAGRWRSRLLERDR